MSKLAKALTAAAGNAGGDNLYVEDVFSTYLYTGNDTDTNIVNGINLADEGGLVWIKSRQAAEGHRLIDSEWSLSANKYIDSSSTTAPFSGPVVNTFNTDGFQLDSNWYGNSSDPQYGGDFASWTFRKAEKFFDVVSGLTSDGSGNLPQFNHNLGSTPGCVIMKATDSGSNWIVFHKGLSASGANQYIQLNSTNAATNATGFGIATDTTFEVGAGSALVPSVTYVAYLFASDAGGFGDDGSESIIKCGSYTGNGSTDGPEIDCGFEPQWLLIKVASGTTDQWVIFDTMRGIATGGDDQRLFANLSNAELSGDYIEVNATGFKPTLGADLVNRNTSDYIYIAIRRPMKTPESGTEVFAAASSNSNTLVTTLFDVDAALSNILTGANHYFSSRLTAKSLLTDTTSAEQGPYDSYDYSKGYQQAISDPTFTYLFKRATGFMDVVAYTGTATSGNPDTFSHNLKATPELMILKCRSTAKDWPVYHADLGVSKKLYLNLSNAQASAFSGAWNTAPTDTVFTVGDDSEFSGGGRRYIAYLFATLDGVSKVDSYTGTGSNVDVDCGFSAGARFILIKRTDSTGDWYVWDSVRGIVAGNDPYLLLNSTAAEVTSTDYIDPLSSGFTVTSSAPAALNASGGTYIFLAIA